MAIASDNYDTLIVGGGAIGLSLAWELAQQGEKVCVVDRGQLGKEASWAGAGMIPTGPAQSRWPLASPYEQLAGFSQTLHPEWHEKLRELTSIDTEYRRCGTLHLVTHADELTTLEEKVARWRELDIAHDLLNTQQIAELEPALASQAQQFLKGYFVPAEAQVRNPRFLGAIIAACRSAGAELRAGTAVSRFESSHGSITSAVTNRGQIYAEKYCLATGCWTGQLAESLGLSLPVRPIRGQMVLMDGPANLIRHVICVGLRYFTPRLDGRLLVGSTLEDVGFQKENTASGIAELMQFATSLAPATAELPLAQRWAGLRPGTADGQPYLGRIPTCSNAWLATGHYRSGLQLAPATAVVMRSLMRGEESPIDVSSLGVERLSRVTA